MTYRYTSEASHDEAPNPFQRVRYSRGMVMGVDEFEQEQAYFLSKWRMHNAVQHGYGTVAGLKVRAEGSRVIVSEGTALDPLGRLIQVYPAQSTDLTAWMQVPQNRQACTPRYPDAGYSLYVTLSYDEEQSDYTPVTGSQTDEYQDTVAYSRTTESFRLTLSGSLPADPPSTQTDRLADLLARLRPSAGGGITEEEMAELVRSLPYREDLIPPGQFLPVQSQRAQAVLETALRVWVTEVRALPMPQSFTQKERPAVWLARLDFHLGPNHEVTNLAVSEQGRPYVLPVRLLEGQLARHLHGSAFAGTAPPEPVRPPAPPPIPAPPPAGGGYRVVAAGEVSPDGTARGFNLRARYAGGGCFRVTFDGYRPDAIYVVKGTPVVRMGDRSPTFEVVHSGADHSILVRVGENPVGFMIEISQAD